MKKIIDILVMLAQAVLVLAGLYVIYFAFALAAGGAY